MFRDVTMENVYNRGNSIERYAWQELTSEDKRYAAEHLNESDEIRENAVAEIKRWFEDEFHIQIGKNGKS